VNSATPALVTEGLTRRFGERVAVDRLSIEVLPGDVYGFLGPNGAGKTTAIRCILGLIRKDAGKVTLFGETDPVRQRAHVGAMVETPRFFDWMSARGNLERAAAFAGQGDRSDIDRALQLVGLWGRESEPVRAYSLGMRQRLGIARALVGKPKLLVLDEPTNGLDPRGMKEVRDLLDHLAKSTNLTIFISSHLLDEIEKLCDRVGIIERGRMIAEGRVADLVAGEAGVTVVEVGASNRGALVEALERMDDVVTDGEGLGGRLRVRLQSVEPSVLNTRLVKAGLSVTALVPLERNLEELFLSLTSKEIT
jgi:ABC-2 type transport system ATP-binding protein